MKTLIINTSKISIMMYIFSFSACADQLSTDVQDRNINASTVMTSKGTRIVSNEAVKKNQMRHQDLYVFLTDNYSVAPTLQNYSTGSRGNRVTTYEFNNSVQEKPEFNVNARGVR